MTLVCEECKQKFESKMGYKYLLKKYNKIICNKCGRKFNAIKNYGSLENYYKYVQAKKTEAVKEKYGVENISQIPEVRKRANTSIKKAQKQRMKTLKENNIKNYGVEYTFQRNDCKENIKKSLKNKYGVEHPLQNEQIKEKQKQTMIKRYGADNAMHVKETHDKVVNSLSSKSCKEWSEIASKRRKKYKYDNTSFDSMWEIKVYKFCKENKIPIERGPTVLLEDGHKFEIDFIINKRLCEIKSSYIISLNRKRAELKKKYILDHNGVFISDDEIKDLSFLKSI